MSPAKKVWELLEAAKEQQDKIQSSLDELDEIPNSLLVGWIGANLDLIEEVIKSLDEHDNRIELLTHPKQATAKKK
jgi:NurA-like 5'-3' nuclease